MKDLIHNLGYVQMLKPQDITNHTDVASGILDLSGFEGANILVDFGAVTNTDANNKVIAVLQESDTTANGDFAAVAAGDMSGAFTAVDAAADDECIQAVEYRGTKRYVRVLLDFTSAGANPDHCPVSITGILGYARYAPVTAPAVPATT